MDLKLGANIEGSEWKRKWMWYMPRKAIRVHPFISFSSFTLCPEKTTSFSEREKWEYVLLQTIYRLRHFSIISKNPKHEWYWPIYKSLDMKLRYVSRKKMRWKLQFLKIIYTSSTKYEKKYIFFKFIFWPI